MSTMPMNAAIEFLSKHEATGKVFFSRGSNDTLTVFIRDPRVWGGNPNREHWPLAREVEGGLRTLGIRRIGEIKIDALAGLLTITIEKFYTEKNS